MKKDDQKYFGKVILILVALVFVFALFGNLNGRKSVSYDSGSADLRTASGGEGIGRSVSDLTGKVVGNACGVDRDCDFGEICYGENCIVGCLDNSECSEGQTCDLESDHPRCVSPGPVGGCSSDNDCADNLRCNLARGNCVQCLVADDCFGTPATPVCDVSTYTCVAEIPDIEFGCVDFDSSFLVGGLLDWRSPLVASNTTKTNSTRRYTEYDSCSGDELTETICGLDLDGDRVMDLDDDGVMNIGRVTYDCSTRSNSRNSGTLTCGLNNSLAGYGCIERRNEGERCEYYRTSMLLNGEWIIDQNVYAGKCAFGLRCLGPRGNQVCVAGELCNGVDDDGDGVIDDGLPQLTYYADVDGDGYGDVSNVMDACRQPDGFVVDSTDCDDTNSQLFPGNVEICDDIDNNCDGIIDDGLPRITYYEDSDMDEFGNPASTLIDCRPPDGFVEDNTDCNDVNNQLFPGNVEVCDGLDNDCDGVVDENCPEVLCNGLDDDGDGVIDDGLPQLTYYADDDGDGYGNPVGNTRIDCSQPDGFVLDSTDCDDTDDLISSGNVEICDNIDNDCDGLADEGLNCPVALGEACGADVTCEDGLMCRGGVCVTATCDDSDNGENLDVVGTTSGLIRSGDTEAYGERTDFCLGDGRVEEFACDLNNVKDAVLSCPPDKVCSGGACVVPQPGLEGEECGDNDDCAVDLWCEVPVGDARGICRTQCSDSDGGVNILQSGSVSHHDGDVMSHVADECVGIAGLIERSCRSGTLASDRMRCPRGNICSEGACIEAPNQCSDSDGGINAGEAGVATFTDENGEEQARTDECINQRFVREAYCNFANMGRTKFTACPQGQFCAAGACMTSQAVCDDPDAKNLDAAGNLIDDRTIRGTTTYTTKEGEERVHEDSCISENSVREGMCLQNYFIGDEHTKPGGLPCPDGTACSDGACVAVPVPPPEPSCEDSDRGNKISTPGHVTFVDADGEHVVSDTCEMVTRTVRRREIEYAEVNEGTCVGKSYRARSILCRKGLKCEEGADGDQYCIK